LKSIPELHKSRTIGLWLAATSIRVVVPDCQAGNRFPGSLIGLQIWAQFGASTFHLHEKFYILSRNEYKHTVHILLRLLLKIISTIPR
jgi:hypothetical protein